MRPVQQTPESESEESTEIMRANTKKMNNNN